VNHIEVATKEHFYLQFNNKVFCFFLVAGDCECYILPFFVHERIQDKEKWVNSGAHVAMFLSLDKDINI